MKLIYFDISGKAESTRLALRWGGIPFDDVRLTREEFRECKDTFPNGQVPVLELDGYFYCQSNSIFRYACKLSGLYPSDPKEALIVDAVQDQLEECLLALVQTFKSDLDTKLATRRKLTGSDGLITRRLRVLNDWVRGDYVLGDRISGADIAVYSFMKWFVSGFFDGIGPEYVCNFSNLMAVTDTVDCEIGKK